LTQWPPDNIYQMLADRCLAIRQTRQWESRMSPRDTVALCVPYELAHGPADAFIDDHEFCHIHPLPEGSLHLTLPDTLRQQAIENGWAELHPLARTGSLSPSLAMVYAPRNEQELEVVLKLVLASSRFARGV